MVARLLADTGARLLVGAAQETYAERREALLAELGRRGIAAHGASGLNVWVPVRDEAAVVNGLRSRGWWVAAGAGFRLAAGPGGGSRRRHCRPRTRRSWRPTSPRRSASSA
jgi:DNA-binding transcriptional MocR family regulator